MPAYTPPSGDAVDFDLEAYTPPAGSAADFDLGGGGDPGVQIGGEATILVSGEGAILGAPALGGEATVTVSAEGAIHKTAYIGGEATIGVSGAGAITKTAPVGGEATILVSGDGEVYEHQTLNIGGEATIVVSGEGGIVNVPYLGGEATIIVSGEGDIDGIPRIGGEATITVHGEGQLIGHPEVFALSRESFYAGQRITISGSGFGSSPALVELSDDSAYGEGTMVTQTVVSWSHNEIVITARRGELDLGAAYLFVTRNPSSDPFPVTILALPPTPPIVPDPTPDQRVAQGLSGLRGPVPSRLIVQRRTLSYLFRDAITTPADAVIDSSMTLSLDNSRAVLRSVRGIELRESALANLPGGAFDPTLDNIAIIEERLIDGDWVVFPLGLYRLEIGDTRYGRDGEPIIECQAHDIGTILTESGPGSTYTVSQGTSYRDAVTAVMDTLGLSYDLDDPGEVLPLTVSWPRWPDTSWYQIVKDLADGVNYRAPWPNAQGRFVWTPWEVDLTTAAASVTYGDDAEPRFIAGDEPYRRRQQAGTLSNLATLHIDNPFHPDTGTSLRRVNDDSGSPISTVYRPEREIEIKWDSSPVSSRCVLDVNTAQDIADTLLRREAARYGTSTLTTLPDPRRGAHEYYRLNVTNPDGSYVENNTLWRVARWSRDLRTGGRMTHDLERVAPVTLSDYEEAS